jgi:hypothetical protein
MSRRSLLRAHYQAITASQQENCAPHSRQRVFHRQMVTLPGARRRAEGGKLAKMLGLETFDAG